MRRTVAATLLLLVVAACKPSLPTEGWSRMMVARRIGEIDRLERRLDAVLTAHAAKGGDDQALAGEVERLLREENWITGWAPPTVGGGEAGQRTLEIARAAPATVEGGAGGLEGVELSPTRHLWWGLYRVGETTYGGIEFRTRVRSKDSEVTVHLYLLPNVRQLR